MATSGYITALIVSRGGWLSGRAIGFAERLFNLCEQTQSIICPITNSPIRNSHEVSATI
jgi:hypothetical protein